MVTYPGHRYERREESLSTRLGGELLLPLKLSIYFSFNNEDLIHLNKRQAFVGIGGLIEDREAGFLTGMGTKKESRSICKFLHL